MKILIDVINPSDVFFFNSIMSGLGEHQVNVTIRNRAETIPLADRLNMKYTLVGKDYNSWIGKRAGLIYRTAKLFFMVPKFDALLCFGNFMDILMAKIRAIPTIFYEDNDLDQFYTRHPVRFLHVKSTALSSYRIHPLAFPIDILIKRGGKKERIFQFHGYKEDVYIADYKPDPDFLSCLPFERFIVVRPEASFALYAQREQSLVPSLLKSFVSQGVNVVYLPRIKGDERFAEGTDAFIPPQTLNGLDLCWYAKAVLTGSGTFAREAACMGTTAISFFSGKKGRLLAVDQQLVNEGKMFHSRDVQQIVDYVLSQPGRKDRTLDLERSKKVKAEVVRLTKDALARIAEAKR